MTLTDVRNAVIAELCHTQSFKLEDLAAVPLTPDLESCREQILRGVVEDLEGAGLVRGLSTTEGGPTENWILTTQAETVALPVELSIRASSAVCEEINAYIDGMENGWPRVDALNLREEHILMLLGIISDLRGDLDEIADDVNEEGGAGGEEDLP